MKSSIWVSDGILKPLTNIQALQYINELERTKADPDLIEYAKSLDKNSEKLAWLKLQGANNGQFKTWVLDKKKNKDLQNIRNDSKESVGADRKKELLFSGDIKNPAVLSYISKLPVTSSELMNGIDGENFKRFLKSNPEAANKHTAYLERARLIKEREEAAAYKATVVAKELEYKRNIEREVRRQERRAVGQAVVPKNTAPLNTPYDPVEAAKKLAPTQDIPAPNNTVSKVVSDEAQKVAQEAQAKAAYERNQELMRANREAKAVAPKVIDDRIKTDLFTYDTGLTVEESKNILQNRNISPTNFYDDEGWRANDTLNKNTSDTRFVGSRKYDAFSNILDYYNRTIDNYTIKSGMSQQESRSFKKQFKQSRGHLSPKGNYAWSHKRDVDGNLILEHLGDNRDAGARSNFATMINSMEARIRAGIQIPAEEMARYKEFMDIAQREGMDTRRLQDNFDALGENYGTYELKIDPNDARYNENFFTSKGNFRSYDQMLAKGYVTTPEEHEKIRRLFITLMDADPETDLDSFMNRPTTVGTNELKSGISEDSLDWREIKSKYRPATERLNRSEKILRLLKKHPAGIVGLLAVAGAANASGGEEDSSYLDRVLQGLEWMDAQTNQGDEAISSIPGVQAVKDIWGGFTNFLNENVQEVNVGPGGTYQAPVENVGDATNAVVSLVNPYEELAFGLGWAMPDNVETQQVEQQPYYTGSGFQAIDEHDAKVNRGLVRDIWFGGNND